MSERLSIAEIMILGRYRADLDRLMVAGQLGRLKPGELRDRARDLLLEANRRMLAAPR